MEQETEMEGNVAFRRKKRAYTRQGGRRLWKSRETEILLWAAEAQPCPQRDVGGKGERPTPILNLRLGLTYYRDFLGTNWSQRAMPVSGGGVWGSSGAIGSASGGGIPGGHPEPKPVFEGLDEEDRIRVEMLQRRDEAVETDRRQSLSDLPAGGRRGPGVYRYRVVEPNGGAVVVVVSFSQRRFFHSSVEGNTTTTLRLKPPNHSSLWR
ncbi:hypothetical protein J4Q44_G00306950 [Coregonus suidteri]|uniref:Uncharacterized protein n=1 Tax=Coregonus suidteri TaxID=861788 RepID=A0AAN8L6I2_9TELE